MRAATATTPVPLGPFRSKRLLALAGDDRLVEQIRRGNELAFEVVFERHGAGILAFCRHMLGSREEAEDAVQQSFGAAFRDIQRGGERRIALKAWLYTIARNRCLSILRARREQAAELQDVPTEGLSEQVERRAELRELLADVRELPDDQRAALLLAEAAGLSHAEVAEVLGCDVGAVKGIVFRARSGLIERRVARETPCGEIREQLATLRGGALRRNELRHHLRHCASCSAYREEIRRQRQLLAVALPVTPTLGLKSSVLGASGISTGAALGGASAGGAALGSVAAAKVALVAVVAGGSVAGGVAVDQARDGRSVDVAPTAAQPARAESAVHAHPAPLQGRGVDGETRGVHGERVSSERSHGRRGAERREARSQGNAYGRERAPAEPKAAKPERPTPPGQSRVPQGKANPNAQSMSKPQPEPKAQPKAQPQVTAPEVEPPAQLQVEPQSTVAPGQLKK